MTEAGSNNRIKGIKKIHEKLTENSEKVMFNSFISCYDNSPDFYHFNGEGKMRNDKAFKKTGVDFYNTRKQQKISTTIKRINPVENGLVISGRAGNIMAQFNNGDTMKMNNYSVTRVLKIFDGKWKIINVHEPALPPQIINNE